MSGMHGGSSTPRPNALTGRVVENANVTPRLHQVIDGVCERFN